MAEEENSLEYTPTWVVAFICFIIVLLSLLAERGLHHLGKYLKRKKQDALFEALQKLKEELMLLGFISLMLTVSQTAIRHICVPPALVSNMFPCKKPLEEEHHAPETSHSLVFNTRHLLSTGASPDHCTNKGKVPLISVEALHHLHIFIFVLAVVHVIFCASTMVLGGARIQQWKRWEDNFKKIPSQKDASKPGHAHAHHAHAHAHAHALHELFNANHEFFKMHAGGFWRRSVVISWLTHCPTNPSFNFHKYMLRTVEMDFKKVVTIRVLVQVLCSYSTLPLYALVTQMGSKFKKGIFDDLVHSTLKVWLSDTRSKGESTSAARRMEIVPTIPESFNVQINEVMECDNP
uniref:MLO-like protein n=1 Tax=Brassica campestris TaxID=3711 RepID=M4DBC0_BRACM